MDAKELLDLYDRQMRIEADYPGIRREDLGQVVRHVGRPQPDGGNFVLYSRLAEANVEQVIDDQIDYFARLGHPFEWKVYDHDSPADLRQRLIRRGFTCREPADAIMALDLQAIPANLQVDPEIDLRRCSHTDQLDDLETILSSVYPNEDFTSLYATLAAEMQLADFLTILIAYVAGQPASCGWTNYHHGTSFVSLWGGTTVPAFRCLGLYRTVLASRVLDARLRGFRYATVDASPMNQPIVAHYGFQLLTMAHACHWRY